MPRIILSYGEHKGYRVAELPGAHLDRLAVRYPLCFDEAFSPDYEDALITLAIHAELSRRAAGGVPEERVPTMRELADEIVTKGYQQASKHHHPDGNGNHEAQLRLTNARKALLDACGKFSDDHDGEENIITIPAEPMPPGPRPRSHPVPAGGIGDTPVE